MDFDWKNWSIGGKIIFVSICVSAVSMFMKWVDIGIASQSGLSQGTFLFLGLYIYPFIMLFKNNPIKRSWGLICSSTAVALALWYISSKSVEMFGQTINAAASGAWLFLLSSIALIVGIIKYTPYGEEVRDKNTEPDA